MADPQTTKPRRLWRVIFALSLALNVAVIGIVLGVGLRDRAGGPPPRGFDVALGPIGRALEKDDRRAIGDALRNNPELHGANRSVSRELLNDFAQALRTAPFSSDALSDVLEAASARMANIQDAARAALLARIVQMTDDERNALADRIEAIGSKRR